MVTVCYIDREMASILRLTIECANQVWYLLDDRGDLTHYVFGIPPWFAESFTIEIDTETNKVKILGYVPPKPSRIQKFFDINANDFEKRSKTIGFTMEEVPREQQSWKLGRGRAFESAAIGIPAWFDDSISIAIDIKNESDARLTLGDEFIAFCVENEFFTIGTTPFELPSRDAIEAFFRVSKTTHKISKNT